MKCDKIRELLSPYLDEMTNEKETNLVKEHLKVCSECQDQLEQIRIVCDMVHKLPAPKLPDNFYHDLELRLVNENFKYFGRKMIKTPKKKGWVAIIAGLALAAGIYASTLLPVSNLVADLKDRFDQDEQKPVMSVNDILKRSGVALNNGSASVQPGSTNIADQISSVVLPIRQQHKINSGQAAVKTGASTPLISQVESCAAKVITSKIIVNDLGRSVGQVIHIAAANECQYEVLPASNTAVQADSGIKGLSIKVDEAKSDKVLDQLNNVGESETPVYSNIELTEQYNEAVKNIDNLQQQIDNIKSQEKISETDQTSLSELEGQLQQWSDKRSQLEDQIQKVTINVYLTEESQP